ncbi:MAG: ATP-binding cassette domain-containing protein [Pseudomonadota bacterium]
MAEAGLVLEDVRIMLGNDVLVSISAEIRPGEVLTVMGPSGSGKSTLLAYLTGTLAPEFRASGAARLNGRPIDGLATEARRIGILFQDHLLFPHLSVAENLAFGLAQGTAKRRQRVEAALAEVGLQGFGPRDPATLSGGQRARVALMRTLLATPEALLLDEPFARLDAELRDQTRSLVFRSVRDLPVVLVTHDLADAAAAGGAVVDVRGRRL